MGKKHKEDPNLAYVKQLDEDPEVLRTIYEHYRDTCIENGGSAAWSRKTSVLVLELLDRLDKAEAERPDALDQTTELKVGDSVVSLIGYMEMRPGTKGKVVAIKPQATYPIEVQFEGIKFLYLKDGLIGFNRDELGKVKDND